MNFVPIRPSSSPMSPSCWLASTRVAFWERPSRARRSTRRRPSADESSIQASSKSTTEWRSGLEARRMAKAATSLRVATETRSDCDQSARAAAGEGRWSPLALMVVTERSAAGASRPRAPKASRPRPASDHTPRASAASRASAWSEPSSASSTPTEAPLAALDGVAHRAADLGLPRGRGLREDLHQVGGGEVLAQRWGGHAQGSSMPR